MKGWHISVEKTSVKALTKFVREHMPKSAELQRRMRLAGLPERCPVSGDSIGDYVAKYNKLPTDDQTLQIKNTVGWITIIQHASGSSDMKYRLRSIVHRHLTKQLRAAGYTIHSFVA